jgi:hypothetical protein
MNYFVLLVKTDYIDENITAYLEYGQPWQFTKSGYKIRI